MAMEFNSEVNREWFLDREIPYEMVSSAQTVKSLFAEQSWPGVVITRARGEGFGLDRPARLVRRSSINDLTLSIHLDGGPIRLEQAGREVTTPRGVGLFYSSIEPMRIRMPQLRDNLMVRVDRTRLRQMTGLDTPLGLRVPASNLALSVIRDGALRLLAATEEVSAQEREHYGRAVTDLLAAVVLSSRSGRAVRPTGPEAMLEQLKADIFARLADPDLGPSDLAARHNISLRYVHKLFGAEPPAAFIRRHRLLAASDLLTRSTPAPLTVASVAAQCGFRDSVTFFRAFRRHYGCTPTEYRELALLRGDGRGRGEAQITAPYRSGGSR